MEDMKDTPIQKAIAELEYAIKNATEVMHEKSGTDEAVMMGQVMFQQNFLKYLQSLLPYERECFVETYNNGAMCDMHVRENKDGTNTQVHLSAYDYFTQTFKQ